MAQRIYRLSPHQNGKVFGILWGVLSLVFVIPMVLMMAAIPVPEGAEPFPFWFMIALPFFYFVMSYLMTALMCWIYNLFFSRSGGLEFELRDEASN